MYPENVQRFRGDFNDRGTIVFTPENSFNRTERTRNEVPGIHNLTGNKDKSVWTKAKDRMTYRRRHMQIQKHLAKHKSDEMKPDINVDSDTRQREATRLRDGVLESDL